MQNPSLYSEIQAQVQQQQPQFPEQEQLKCPRCDSANTKFCYYNNYNLSQPRHFCRSCKRYWTKGGALRNIPVGGGSRKNSKRSSSSSADADSAASKRPAVAASPPPSPSKDEKNSDRDKAGEVFDTLPLRGDNFSGQFESLSFSSLLGTGGDQYVGLLDGLGPNGPGLEINGHFGETGSGPNTNPGLDIGVGGDGDEFLNLQDGCGAGVGGGGGGGGGGDGDSGCWGGGGGDWPDLSIYTPSSNFQ